MPNNLTDSVRFSDAVSTLYAVDLGAMFAILGGFTFTLANEERNLIPKGSIRQYRFEGVSWFLCGLIFVASALPVFFVVKATNGEPIRYYLWIIPLLLIWITRNWYRYEHKDAP